MEPAASWRPVGAILVENGSITQAQLNAALAEQTRTGRKLGDILTSSGAITWTTLAEAIAEQAMDPVRPEAAAPVIPVPPPPPPLADPIPTPDDRQRVLRELASLTDNLGALISRLQDHVERRPGR
jgi:type IV pilus assembly protein PilB